jgi:hypothetical protein
MRPAGRHTLSFKHTIKIVRRNLPFYAAFPPNDRARMEEILLIEITLQPADRSRGLNNPRSVKRKMSHFAAKSGAQPLLPPRQSLNYAD